MSILHNLKWELVGWVNYSSKIQGVFTDLGIDDGDVEGGHSLARKMARKYGNWGIEQVERMIEELKTYRSIDKKNASWDLEELREIYPLETPEFATERIVGSKFLDFITNPKNNSDIPQELSQFLCRIRELTDCSDLSKKSRGSPARGLTRKIHLHVGPTNSGKTYNALLALGHCQFGAYAGPLRLLAQEIYNRFNKGRIIDRDGTPLKRDCNMLTGEEVRIINEAAGLTACTVEMMNHECFRNVVVVDEIQMIGDPNRGSAWTLAVLENWTKELHLCGEDRVVGLIENIAKLTGDEVIIHRYQRLSPLKVANYTLNHTFQEVKKGDCVVTFSRNNIFALKRMIEQQTGLKVAVAYGALPPEVRESQAEGFNDGKYDVLVASDAVGMGLNL
jgi:thymidine kinase